MPARSRAFEAGARKPAVTTDAHHRSMSSRRRRLDEAKRAAIAELTNLGAELRTGREQAGLTQRAVAATLGWRRERVSRIENTRLHRASLVDLVMHSAALGLTLRARVYPDGPPLRDVGQLSVSQRVLQRISDRWRVRMEVPLSLPGDRRAFDLWLAADGVSIAVEVFTRLRDVQAQIRGAHLKWRDSNATRLLVVVAQSHPNRASLKSVEDLLVADFPIGARATWAALAEGRDPGGNAIVVV
jgi:transcriptional regulator with XRE-family HTH domain